MARNRPMADLEATRHAFLRAWLAWLLTTPDETTSQDELDGTVTALTGLRILAEARTVP